VRQSWMCLVGVCLVSMASACGDEPAVTTPTPSPPPGAPAPLVHVDVTPVEVTLLEPGQTQQLSAIGRRSDGTTADVAAELHWSTADPAVATVSGRGLVTARSHGSTLVLARTGERYWNPVQFRMPVPAGLKVPLTGIVRDQHGAAVPGASVDRLAGDIDHAGITDAAGAFDLGPSYGSVRLQLSRFGYDTTRVTVPDVAAQPHLQLTLMQNPSPFVERRLEGQVSGGVDVHRIVTRAGATLDVLAEPSQCVPGDGLPRGVGLRLASGARGR
jgi:hypothetical protein